MPTYLELRGDIYPRGVLQVCEEVHATTKGSGERNPADQLRDIELLKKVNETWYTSECPYDACVRQLVLCVIEEAEKK